MFHTEACETVPATMTDSDTPGASRRTYSAALAELISRSTTSYRLRALIQDDEVLRQADSLSDAELLARLDALVREDEAVGAREVPPVKPPVEPPMKPPMKRLGTMQERAEAFRHANALNRLEGYEPSEEFLQLQARVIAGEISVDDVVRIAIERAKARDAGKA